MFIRKKAHEKIINLKNQRIDELELRLKEAQNLKAILEKLSSMKINGQGFAVVDGSWTISECKLNLPDDVMRYVDDILGGKCIKQEANKCIVISKDGTVKTGLTKSQTDKGYSYKLVRE